MRRLAFATIALLPLLAGCPGPSAFPTRAELEKARKNDMSCLRTIRVVIIERYDLNADGRDELFLVLRCRDAQDPHGDQLEVIPGDKDPKTGSPTKLFLQMPHPSAIDKLCFANQTATYRVTGTGTGTGTTKIEQVKWRKDAAEPGPSAPGPLIGCP